MPNAPVGGRNSAGTRYSLLVSIATGLAVLGISLAATAADGDKFSDWTMRCEKPQETLEERCHIFQNAKDEENGRDIAQILVGNVPQLSEPLMFIMLPLGVFLPSGVQIQVDGNEPVGLPFEVCTPDGCRAGAPMKEPLMGAFKNGLKLNLKVKDFDGRDVDIPMSLKSFTAGLNALPK